MTAAAAEFTGEERDAETGLDYFGARYFTGAQGRFTTPDPYDDQRQGEQSADVELAGRSAESASGRTMKKARESEYHPGSAPIREGGYGQGGGYRSSRW